MARSAKSTVVGAAVVFAHTRQADRCACDEVRVPQQHDLRTPLASSPVFRSRSFLTVAVLAPTPGRMEEGDVAWCVCMCVYSMWSTRPSILSPLLLASSSGSSLQPPWLFLLFCCSWNPPALTITVAFLVLHCFHFRNRFAASAGFLLFHPFLSVWTK